MTKQDYINELDNLHASSDLKEKIAAAAKAPVKKTFNFKRFGAIIAACLSLVIIGTAVFGATLSAEKSADGITETNNFSYNNSNSMYSSSADPSTDIYVEESASASNTQSNSQKIIKTASIYMHTNDIDELLKKINAEISSLNGLTSSYSQDKYNESGSVNTVIQIPAEKLDEFIAFLDEVGAVKSKQISSKNITEIYTDTESRIKAYETEEKTLLGILEKCESVADIITVQDRLSEIRSELETLNNTKKLYDSQISYSSVELSISEVDRVKKSSDSFGSEVLEKLTENLYNIGRFFRSFAIFILSATPYLAMIAVAAIIIIVILKKRKRRYDK